MITEALRHCRGVGRVRLEQLHALGVRSWHDAVAEPERIPAAVRQQVVQECDRCLQALADSDIRYFLDRFCPQDKWRILAEYPGHASFFDIETTGLEYDDTITVIVCWHQDRLHTFVEHENLDEFLDLLDSIPLLVSFNGSSFDVPRLLEGFHIPELPCPHLDLRWPCYHRGFSGGLKQVAARLGISRPADLQDVAGDEAVRLWSMWRHQQNQTAREQLIRYCAADVLLLRPVAQYLAGHPLIPAQELWQQLPDQSLSTYCPEPPDVRYRELEKRFGAASPAKLRTRRRPSGR